MTTITRTRALIAGLAALAFAVNISASPLPSVALAGAAPLTLTVNSTDWHD